MDVSSIAVIVTLVLIGLGFVALALFSIRNLFNGKHSLGTILSFFIPVAVFGVCYAITGADLSQTAVLSVVVMFVGALAALFLTGLKSIFN